MPLFDWFKTPVKLDPGTGANLDTRPETERQKDHSFVETVASANVVNWVEKPENQWRKFPEQNQNGSSSCVAQTVKKCLGIMYWLKHGTFVRFSATHIYQRRSNRPAGGMFGVEAFDLAMKSITLEELVASESMTDGQMDSKKVENYHDEVGKVFTIGGHLGTLNGDIDNIASIIQTTGKGVMVWFYFTAAEWSKLIPVVEVGLIDERDHRALRHSVTAVDYTLYKGKKALIIEDSAHFGGLSRRIITEDFFKKRHYFGRYPMNFRFQGAVSTNKPTYNFSPTKILSFIPLNSAGQISDPVKNAAQKNDVIALQNILKFEGLFPSNVESTGYFGSMTAKWVLAFQKKHNVDSDASLDPLQGRTVGPKTISVLNQLYGN